MIRNTPIFLLAALVVTGKATAADVPPTEQLEEIVVTAEKRDATVQQTGISITALKGSDLLEAGVVNVQSVAQQIPGISFKTGGPGQTELAMRGLNSSGGNSPTVGFYLDETPLTTFAFATAGKVVIDPNLYDLNRIEVLRGPQGTLYGAGSMGGTVRLITNQPSLDTMTANGQVIGSNTERGKLNGTANGMVNLPIVAGVAALRIVGTEKYNSGWIDRTVLSDFPLPSDPSGVGFGTIRGDVQNAQVEKIVKDVNSVHLQGARATLLVKPSDVFSLSAMGMYQKTHSGGQSLVDAIQTSRTLTSANDATYRVLNTMYQPLDTPEPVDDEFELGSLLGKYQLESAEIVSTSSWWSRSLQQVQDGSEVMQYVLQMPSYYTDGGGLGSGPWIENDSARQFSQELRLASRGDSRFHWVIGGFYNTLRSIQHQYANYYDPAATANFAAVDPLAIDANGKATSLDQTVNQRIEQKAAFGEVSLQASTLQLSVGLRYFDFKSDAVSSEFGLFAPAGDLNPVAHTTHEHDNGVNPKFNVTWRPSGNFTGYGTVSKGFRPGGANQIIPTQGVADGGTPEGDACRASLSSLGRLDNPTAYQADSVWNYEVGQKARLFDGRVTLNSAAYYERWNNIQRSITLGCAYIYSDNAGSANIRGGEVELTAKLTERLRLSANAGVTHATYSDVYELPAIGGTGALVSRTGVQDGQRLPDVPEFTSSQTISYRAPVGHGLSLSAQVTNSYVSSREETTSAFTNGSGNSNIPVHLPSYDLLSARVGFSGERGWTVAAFIDNITDNQAPLSAINSQVLNITPVRRLTIGQPRTFGLDFTFGL